MKRIFTAAVVLAALAMCSVAAAAVVTLKGTWKETVHSTALGGELNGTWAVKFANGAYHVTQSGHPVVHGKFTIKGSKISLKDTGGSGACPGTGVYKFKVTGNSLTFKLVSDKNAGCVGRRDVLIAGTFKKS